MLVITILPRVTDIGIVLTGDEGETKPVTKQVFFPEVNKTVKELLLEYEYTISTIYIDMTSPFSEKIYNNLVADNEIDCEIVTIGE